MQKIIVAFLLIPVLAFAAEFPCGGFHEKRTVIGEKPTSDILYENLKNIEEGSWKTGFWSETFSYLGEVHTRNGRLYKVGFLTTIWGDSCRTTNRLFIFASDNICLGQYGGILEFPLKISGSTLVFPFNEQDGSIINFENGPPLEIMLDGESFAWTPAKKL